MVLREARGFLWKDRGVVIFLLGALGKENRGKGEVCHFPTVG